MKMIPLKLMRKKIVLRVSGDSFYSSLATLAGQGWSRASYLMPLPTPLKWARPLVHDLSRRMRAWWPLWFVYGVSGGLLGVVWGCGDELIRREIGLVRKGDTWESLGMGNDTNEPNQAYGADE